jgi:hypothetical protein
MKIDFLLMMKQTFSNPAVVKFYIFLFLVLVFVILVNAVANRFLKKFNPKPLKTSTLVIVLIMVGILAVVFSKYYL